MISVDVVLDPGGLPEFVAVKGHARAGPRGGDIVCAAVSVLFRTLMRTLSGRKGIEARGASLEGDAAALEISWTAEGRDFLAAAGAFFMEGIHSVCEEYPDYCRIKVWRN